MKKSYNTERTKQIKEKLVKNTLKKVDVEKLKKSIKQKENEDTIYK